MNLRTILLSVLIVCFAGPTYAVHDTDNYATEANAILMEKAGALYNKGKYAEARILMEEVLASGDTFYSKKCKEQLAAIKALEASRKKQSATVFTISQDTVKINRLGGDYPVHVTGENWSATVSGDDWCRIEVNRRKGLITIISSPNESTESRTAVITVRNGNGKRKNIEVISEGSPEILRCSAQNLVFTPDGETSIVDVDANTEWSLADVPGWLQAVKGQDEIQFTATANGDNRDRTANVKIETPSRQQIIINIIQGAALDSLAFSKNNLSFGADGGDEYIRVFTDADEWRFGDFPHWCQLERIGNNTIKVHCTPNEPVDMPREASINVTTGRQTLGINVIQSPKPIVHLIPVDGIGGRYISYGFSVGYINPMVCAGSSSQNTFSPINYAQGNNLESVNYKSSGGLSVSVFADMRLYKNLYLNAGIDFMCYKYKNTVEGIFDVILPGTWQYYLRGNMNSEYKEEYTMSTVDIPILASYRFPLTRTSHLRINAGPVIGFGIKANLDLNGHSNSSSMRSYRIVNGQMTNQLYDQGLSTSNLYYQGALDMYSKNANLVFNTSDGGNGGADMSSTLEAAPYNRMNFGLQFGIGYEFMGISINLSYRWMFSNMGNRKFWDSDRWQLFNNATYLMNGYSQHNNLLMVEVGYTFRY